MRQLKIFLGVVLALGIGGLGEGMAQVSLAKAQVAGAVAPAPDDLQKEAKVLGYDAEGHLKVLRAGTNELVCLADNPTDDRFHAACYHKSLEPFMNRGRELRAQQIPGGKIDSVRLEEIRSGALQMPDQPTTLYSLTGKDVDPTAEKVNGRRLTVVYVPYATGELTGLPTKPVGNLPWLMDAGKPWAHIMISGSSKP